MLAWFGVKFWRLPQHRFFDEKLALTFIKNVVNRSNSPLDIERVINVKDVVVHSKMGHREIRVEARVEILQNGYSTHVNVLASEIYDGSHSHLAYLKVLG